MFKYTDRGEDEFMEADWNEIDVRMSSTINRGARRYIYISHNDLIIRFYAGTSKGLGNKEIKELYKLLIDLQKTVD